MTFDLILAGGGLSAGLIALALRARRPDARVAVVEQGPAFGGNHTWCCFAADFSAEGAALAAPLIEASWPSHELRFPAFTRQIDAIYQSGTSRRLHAALMAALPDDCRFLGVPISTLAPDSVQLADGRCLQARAVIDARGDRPTPALDLGFQKFLGIEMELASPHHLAGPIIMDATVAQHDGYRFVYVLPFSPTRVLIEDTYYADGPALETDNLRARITDYGRTRGWQPLRHIREEQGVLPIALGGNIHRHLAGFPPGVPPVGMAAGLFHPVTGYSFPDAVRLALHVAELRDLSGPALDRALRGWAAARWQERGFYRLLNKMLFRAASPQDRWRVLQRFYRLDAGLVGRFYAGHSSLADKLRIVSGKPPVPLGRAVAAVLR
ncbi:MAG: lycopene beta-cyclase CrtY [Sphingomonadaceae bacterium]